MWLSELPQGRTGERNFISDYNTFIPIVVVKNAVKVLYFYYRIINTYLPNLLIYR